MIPNLCLSFLQLRWLLSYQQICDLSLNKSCKTYLGPMLSPGNRILLQIYPAKFLSFKLVWLFLFIQHILSVSEPTTPNKFKNSILNATKISNVDLNPSKITHYCFVSLVFVPYCFQYLLNTIVSVMLFIMDHLHWRYL